MTDRPFLRDFTTGEHAIQVAGKHENNPWILIGSDPSEFDREWVEALQRYFVALLPKAIQEYDSAEELTETMDALRRELDGDDSFRSIGYMGIGAHAEPILSAVQSNPMGIPYLVLVNPSVGLLESCKVLPIPIAVILGLGDSEPEEEAVRTAFSDIVAPDKVIFEIKKGGGRPMDAQPALFTIAVRQAVYRFLQKK